MKPYNVLMKRIALIRNSYPLDVGGAEKFPVNLAKLLPHDDFTPFILSANKKTLAIASSAGLKTARSPWWSFQNFSGTAVLLFPVYIAWICFVIGWYIAFFLKHRIDIAHPQSRDDFIAATIAAKLLHKKVIWTDHADLKYIFMNHATWYKNPAGKLVYLASQLADSITIGSHSEKQLVEMSLGKKLPAKYTVVYLGVVDTLKPTKRADDWLVFVSTSRLVSAKGIAELIEAFKSINDKNAILNICGDGPEADRFASLAAGVKNIKFLGHVDNVGEVLQEADIFVHPSYHESFGLSLVEAEMHCLPIIACNVGSIPEIVKDGINGILVPPKDASQLATAMTRLAHNRDLRRAMGQHGRAIYLERFQFDAIVKDRILPLYEA